MKIVLILITLGALIGFLMTPRFACGGYGEGPKTEVTKTEMQTLRACVIQYSLKNGRSPNGFQELIDSNYIKVLPKDAWDNYYSFIVKGNVVTIRSEGPEEDKALELLIDLSTSNQTKENRAL
jgi:hypothetical protein